MKYYLASLVAGIFLLSSCSGGSDDTSATGIIGTVSNDMIPASLEYGLTDDSVSVTSSGDPCEEYQSEYGSGTIGACQPKLMRIYLNMAKLFLDTSKIMVEEIGEDIGEVADGTSDTIDWGEGQTLVYSKTDSAHYTVLIKQGTTPVAYLDVNGMIINVKIDLDEESGLSSEKGKFEGTIEYEDEDHYNVTLMVLDQPCVSDDVGGPRNMKIIIDKEWGVWSGYAMTYHPRWGGSYKSLSCNSTETADTGVLMYSNFVGNDTAAKANVFVMKRTISNSTFDDDLDDYGINRMCNHYSDILGGTACVSAAPKMASFVNSYCNPTSTLEAIWDDDCFEFDDDIPYELFPTGLWVYPSRFYDIETTFNIPTSL